MRGLHFRFLLITALSSTLQAMIHPWGSRRSWITTAASGIGLVGVEQAFAVELLYKKQEVLQGRIFEKERGQAVANLLFTFTKAKEALHDYEARLEFGGKVNEVRLALRSAPFQNIRKDGKEILSLTSASDEAFGINREPSAKAAMAFKDILDGLQDVDGAALRAVREGAPIADVSAKLHTLQQPISAFIDSTEAFVISTSEGSIVKSFRNSPRDE